MIFFRNLISIVLGLNGANESLAKVNFFFMSYFVLIHALIIELNVLSYSLLNEPIDINFAKFCDLCLDHLSFAQEHKNVM